ncbi:hypothetical protein OH77DRAFT_384080 [Trametes cingulata]|nr:hypothetical protein OH77DRAFT_384080 [Trametes cingulata]
MFQWMSEKTRLGTLWKVAWLDGIPGWHRTPQELGRPYSSLQDVRHVSACHKGFLCRHWDICRRSYAPPTTAAHPCTGNPLLIASADAEHRLCGLMNCARADCRADPCIGRRRGSIRALEIQDASDISACPDSDSSRADEDEQRHLRLPYSGGARRGHPEYVRQTGRNDTAGCSQADSRLWYIIMYARGDRRNVEETERHGRSSSS